MSHVNIINGSPELLVSNREGDFVVYNTADVFMYTLMYTESELNGTMLRNRSIFWLLDSIVFV